jgi:hypothetical protein
MSQNRYRPGLSDTAPILNVPQLTFWESSMPAVVISDAAREGRISLPTSQVGTTISELRALRVWFHQHGVPESGDGVDGAELETGRAGTGRQLRVGAGAGVHPGGGTTVDFAKKSQPILEPKTYLSHWNTWHSLLERDGPAIADGVVYWGSGYAHISPGKPNNRFLAFAPTQ